MVHARPRLEHHAKRRRLLDRSERRLIVDAQLGQRLGQVESSRTNVDTVQRAQEALSHGTELHPFRWRRPTPRRHGRVQQRRRCPRPSRRSIGAPRRASRSTIRSAWRRLSPKPRRVDRCRGLSSGDRHRQQSRGAAQSRNRDSRYASRRSCLGSVASVCPANVRAHLRRLHAQRRQVQRGLGGFGEQRRPHLSVLCSPSQRASFSSNSRSGCRAPSTI